MVLRGDEAAVVAAFARWLQASGWEVRTEVNGCDVVATRGGRTLYAEAKGRTANPTTDVDTAFGQLLRRMGDDGELASYGLVVRDEPRSVRAVLRVPQRVRDLMQITLYGVAEDGSVRVLKAGAS